MIEAIVAGYEVAARLAAATSLARPLMPHGVWSAPASAAAAAVSTTWTPRQLPPRSIWA